MQDRHKATLAGLICIVVIATFVSCYQIRRESKSRALQEPSEYVNEVLRCYTDNRTRFPIIVKTESVRVNEEDIVNSQKLAKNRTHFPKIEGKVAVFESQSKLGSVGGSVVLRADKLSNVHFQIPRSKRADKPEDMDTVIFMVNHQNYRIENRRDGNVVGSLTRVKLVVYAIPSGHYYTYENEIDSENVAELVIKLLGK